MATIPVTATPNPYGFAPEPLPLISTSVAANFSVLAYPPGAQPGSLRRVLPTRMEYTPPNMTGSYVIRAVQQSNAANFGDVAVSVFGRLPHQPNWGIELDLDDKTLVSVAEDDSTIFSLKRGPLQTWRMQWINRPFREKEDLKSFWKWHRKFRFWYYQDESEGDEVGFEPETYLVRFDSGLKIVPGDYDNFNITAIVTQHPFTTP